MSSAILEKIKPYIDSSLVSKFDTNDMLSGCYVPICVQKGFIYVLVTSLANKDNVKQKVSKTLNTDKVALKEIASEDFQLIIKHIRESLGLSEGYSDSNISKDEESEIHEIKYEAENTLVSEYDHHSEYHDKNEGEHHPEDIKDSGKVNTNNKLLGKKIGEVLVQMGYATNEQINEALQQSKKKQIPLGTELVNEGIITLQDLKKALTLQQGYEAVTEEQLKISSKTLEALPEDFMQQNKVLPIVYDEANSYLEVAMVNPNDKKVIKDIIFLTGINPTITIITHYEFQKYSQTFFSANKKSTDKIIRKIQRQNKRENVEETIYDQIKNDLQDDSSITVQFTNKIITDAIDMKVSDIHIEPRLQGYVVRYRKDGILQVVMTLPEGVQGSILTRLKVMSKMNIAEHRRPQDGSFSLTHNNNTYDFRINTLPVGEEEKMVIRVLAPAVSMATTKDEMQLVGASPEELNIIKKMESVPNGIILTTGPTGSGKTTTLYTLLKAINDPTINITTIEDPVEIKIDGINQSQINAKAGITFASCMRAILRQDPDVILVGEIRDIETLETAISAALTGHLVLSTLHTNSAAATITRLIDMGAKDYLISATLIGIIAQRLVRGLCPHCRVQTFPTREQAELVVAGGEKEIQEFMKTPVYKHNGCDKCNFTGYIGRLGVYEIMPITKEIKKLIAQGAHDIDIEEAAIGAGMKTLHQVCLRHIIEGKTTIDEFLRVLGPVKE